MNIAILIDVCIFVLSFLKMGFRPNTYKIVIKSSSKSKGDRLGWVSIKDAKKYKLSELLVEKQYVEIKDSQKPLLVP